MPELLRSAGQLRRWAAGARDQGGTTADRPWREHDADHARGRHLRRNAHRVLEPVQPAAVAGADGQHRLRRRVGGGCSATDRRRSDDPLRDAAGGGRFAGRPRRDGRRLSSARGGPRSEPADAHRRLSAATRRRRAAQHKSDHCRRHLHRRDRRDVAARRGDADAGALRGCAQPERDVRARQRPDLHSRRRHGDHRDADDLLVLHRRRPELRKDQHHPAGDGACTSTSACRRPARRSISTPSPATNGAAPTSHIAPCCSSKERKRK